MLYRFKFISIAILFVFGGIFMISFPPRNYKLSGFGYRTALQIYRRALNSPTFIDHENMIKVAERLALHEKYAVKVKYLQPNTQQNRSLIALELRSDLYTKPGILVIAGMNGMAWASPNAIIEFAGKLLYDMNYQTPYFNDYNWFLIPLVNPDGLNFTRSVRNLPPINPDLWSRDHRFHSSTRPYFWFKNMDREENEKCWGTNINRNFAYHWQDDVRKAPPRCSQFYPGKFPFSTAEGQALRNYLQEVGHGISLAIHLNAGYSTRQEYILYPWRYSLRRQSNFETLQDIGEFAARHSLLPEKRFYKVHQASSDERVAGTLSDYLTGVVGVDLVFVLKPYMPPFYNNGSDHETIDSFTDRAITAILSLVRGWRRLSKDNTLHFYGTQVEY